MKVTNVFTLRNGIKVISGLSDWNDNIYHEIGDILVCGSQKWKVTDVSYIIQGCFGIPTHREHDLCLQPVDHEDQPNVGDILVSE